MSVLNHPKKPGKQIRIAVAMKTVLRGYGRFTKPDLSEMVYTLDGRGPKVAYPGVYPGTYDANELPMTTEAAVFNARWEAERRELERNAQGSHTQEEWESILDRFDNRCVRCEIRGEDTLEGRLTKDHIAPLSEGGTNYASNLQPLCRSCNSWKGEKEIDYRSTFQRRTF